MAAFLVWNTRGKSGRNLDLLIQNLVREHQIDVLLLVEYYPLTVRSTLSTLLLAEGIVRRKSSERFGVFARTNYAMDQVPVPGGG